MPGAKLRYTTDGTEPGPDSQLYTTPFKLKETTTVKARAYKTGYSDGPITSQTFEIQ